MRPWTIALFVLVGLVIWRHDAEQVRVILILWTFLLFTSAVEALHKIAERRK